LGFSYERSFKKEGEKETLKECTELKNSRRGEARKVNRESQRGGTERGEKGKGRRKKGFRSLTGGTILD